MPTNDWTCVEAGIFHHFHQLWSGHISEALNAGLLPAGYYAMVEQRTNEIVPDVLALHSPTDRISHGNGKGAVAVLDTPPKVSHKFVGVLRQPKRHAQRQVVIRHVSHHRVVALIEIVSPANQDRASTVRDFASKARGALELGVNLLIVDLFPPGKHDPFGMHGAIWTIPKRDREAPPTDKPMCLMSYVAKVPADAYLEWVGVGAALPEMPLFLDAGHYVGVPLESTYETAYRGVPEYWRKFIAQHQPPRRRARKK